MSKQRFLLAAASLGLFLLPIVSHLQAAMDIDIGKMKVETKEIPTSQKSDEDITKGLKDSFASDKHLSQFIISVLTKDGVVTLTGFVDSEQSKADFAKRAKDVAGVKSVVNNIQVKPAAAK